MEDVRKFLLEKAEKDEEVLVNAYAYLKILDTLEQYNEDILEVLNITNSTDMEEAIPKIRRKFKEKKQ